MLASTVQQATIGPWITAVIQQGSVVNTDEYSLYARLPAWGTVMSRSTTVKGSRPGMPMETA